MAMRISRIKGGFHEYFFTALATMACCLVLSMPNIANAGAGGTTVERLNEPTPEGVEVKVTASIITTKTWSLNFDASYSNTESGLYLINLNALDGESTFPENSTSSAEMIFNLKNLAIGENTVRVAVNYTGANEEEKTFAETVFPSEYKFDYQPAPVELPIKIEGDANPLINTTTTIKAYAFEFDSTSGTSTWSLLPDATIIINGQENQSADGMYDFWTNTTTPYTISAKKTGYINSQNFFVNATLPEKNIHLQIAGPTNDLFNDNINVPACEESAGSGIYTINGKCAVQETKLDNSWSMWGTDAFLNSIGEFENNKDYNGIYWLWFSNLEEGGVALNKHELKTLNKTENLLLTYGRYPLKIDAETTSTTPMLNTTTTISVKEFGFDGEWKPAWISAVSSTLVFGEGQEIGNEGGAYELFITTTTPYIVYGKKNGFLDSAPITIIGQELTVEEPPAENNPPPDNGGGGGGGGSDNDQPPANPTVSDADIKTAVDKILAYLKSKQDTNGGIIVGYDINNNPITDAGVTDWAIMSFGANGEYASDIKNGDKSLLDFAKEYNFTDGSEMNKCAGYPRHILALLSAGVGPTDLTVLGLKEKINTICYKNNLYGENGINDDVFGLIALLATGVSQDEPIIQDMVKTIKNEQTADGSFTYTDFTGIAINALKFAETKGVIIDPAIYTKAKNYLKPIQLEDGGWGQDLSYPLTTSWVMMGINALGEKQNDWTKENKNPWHVLVEKLSANGYYECGWAPGTVEWFSTKHAVPALLGKSWPIILPPRVTPPETQQATGGGNAGNQSQTPTTTPTFTTSTTYNFTTSTPTTTIQNTDNITQTATTTLEHLSTSAPEHFSTTTETTVPMPNSDNRTPTKTPQDTSYKLQDTNKITNSKLQIPNQEIKEQLGNETTGQSLSPAPPEPPPEPVNPVRNAAKKLFAGSSIAAGGLGLYLAWRLLQTMV